MRPFDLADMVAAAIALGRLRVIAQGVRALPVAAPAAPPLPIRPEACGCGRLLSRRPGLDVYDKARAS